MSQVSTARKVSSSYKTGESFCDFTIKLSENVRIHRRTYTKLITILGDVGGLMEVVFTLFRVVSSFSVDILYDISLVNNLFSFDLDKKIIILKDKKNEKKNYFPTNEEPRIYNQKRPFKKMFLHKSIRMNEEMTIGTGNRMNEDYKNKLHNDNKIVVKFSRRKSSFKGRANFSPVNSSESKNKIVNLWKK